MKWLFTLLLMAWCVQALAQNSCTATVGTLTLNATVTRTTGAAPLLTFFDATATTDTATLGGANNTFQDVAYQWSFGDPFPSGTGHWPYGAASDPGRSKDSAVGPVAAHVYQLPVNSTTNVSYIPEVWATDGVNIATCKLALTVTAPSNAYAGTSTICRSTSGTFTGCPAGATNTTIATVAYPANNTRILYRCAETFTGNMTLGSTSVNTSIGAYGGCEGTGTGLPTCSATTMSVQPNNPTDSRIADVDCETTATGTYAISSGGGMGQSQMLIYGVRCVGYTYCFALNQQYHSGLVASYADIHTNTTPQYGVFWNYAQNNCANGGSGANCTTPGSAQCSNGVQDTEANGTYCSVKYNALIGNYIEGASCQNGATGCPQVEALRISACRYCILSDNTVTGGVGGWGAVLKLHSGNTFNTQGTWIGQYTEYVVENSNLFQGLAGSNLVENVAQNQVTDERMRYIILDGNLFRQDTAGSSTGRLIILGAANSTVRNNVFFSNVSGSTFGLQIAQRGIEPIPTAVEVYNNTCYATGATIGQCIAFSATNMTAAGNSSWAMNNLYYNNGSTGTTVTNNGTSNTVSNNSTNGATNPTMKNLITGSLSLLGDFNPTTATTGATTVTVRLDACAPNRFSWLGAYRLGALSGACP